jgi:hypothetical protein
MSKYNEELVLDLMQKIRSGASWEKITGFLNRKYDLIEEHTAYRNLYHRKKAAFEVSDEGALSIDLLKKAASAKKASSLNNKKARLALDDANFNKNITEQVNSVLKEYSGKKISVTTKKIVKKKNKKKSSMTLVLDVSDIHGGLKTDTYGYGVIKRRLDYLVLKFVDEIERNMLSYNVEDLVVSINGDVVENAQLHEDSIKSCEESNPGQISTMTSILFDHLIAPIAKLGLKVRIPCTAGNHDRVSKLRCMYQQGKEGYSWIVYTLLEKLCKVSGFKNMDFHIPEGYGVVLNVQGSNILWEHGDLIKTATKAGLVTHLINRQDQLNIKLHGLRVGHTHEFFQIGRRVIVNGPLMCGNDYSSSAGYSTEPTQTISSYVKSKDRENSLFRVFPVVLP